MNSGTIHACDPKEDSREVMFHDDSSGISSMEGSTKSMSWYIFSLPGITVDRAVAYTVVGRNRGVIPWGDKAPIPLVPA